MRKHNEIVKNAWLLCAMLLMVLSSLFLEVTYAKADGEDYLNVNQDNLVNEQTENNIMLLNKEKGDVIKIIGRSGAYETYPLKDLKNVKFIPNANYFLVNPYHGENNTADNSNGTCTTVAAQMLVGYHNYYSDRRIIPKNGKKFLDDNYGAIEYSPIFKRHYAYGQGCVAIGTRDELYREILNQTKDSDSLLGQAIGNVADGVNNFFDNYTDSSIRSGISFRNENFNVQVAKTEIDEGRPIILGLNGFKTWFNFHVMVAYGYAQLDGEDGFLVHCGWKDSVILGWFPTRLFGYQIRMSVNHQHNLRDMGESVAESANDINGDTQKENYTILKCDECGYTTPDFLYKMSDTITLVITKKK